MMKSDKIVELKHALADYKIKRYKEYPDTSIHPWEIFILLGLQYGERRLCVEADRLINDYVEGSDTQNKTVSALIKIADDLENDGRTEESVEENHLFAFVRKETGINNDCMITDVSVSDCVGKTVEISVTLIKAK